MSIMDQISNLSPAVKIGGVAALGAATYLLFKGGGGVGGAGGGLPDGTIILPNNYEAMEHLDTPGSQWGSDGYQYFAEVNAQNMDLLRRIWDSQQQKAPTVPTVPVTPPTIPPVIPHDTTKQRINNLVQSLRINRGRVRDLRDDGVTRVEGRRINTITDHMQLQRERIAELEALRVQSSTTPPPTPRVGR